MLCGHCSRSFCTFCGTTLYQRHLTDCKGSGEAERERAGKGSAAYLARATQDPHSSQKCQSHVYGSFLHACVHSALYNTVCVCVHCLCFWSARGICSPTSTSPIAYSSGTSKCALCLPNINFHYFISPRFCNYSNNKNNNSDCYSLVLPLLFGEWPPRFVVDYAWRLRLSLIFAALFSAFSDFRGIYINSHTLSPVHAHTHIHNTHKNTLSHTHATHFDGTLFHIAHLSRFSLNIPL